MRRSNPGNGEFLNRKVSMVPAVCISNIVLLCPNFNEIRAQMYEFYKREVMSGIKKRQIKKMSDSQTSKFDRQSLIC